MATRPRFAVRPVLGGWLLASGLLGCVDALLAAWSNRGVAPHATLPLCLTAPFVVGLAVLLPAALVVALASVRRAPSIPETTAALLGVAAAGATLRAGEVLRSSWQGTGAAPLGPLPSAALLAAALAAGWLGRGAVLPWLRRRDARWTLRVVVLAALVHATALAGVLWQLRREGRGLVHDRLAASLGDAAVARSDAASTNARPIGTPRNLLLITVDALRADHLDAARMPQTSAFAASATRFAAAYAASSWTLPAVASLLTGLPAARHGAGRPLGDDPLARSPLAPGAETLAAHLRRAGFATRAIVTNPYLGLGYGLGRGFDAFENVTLESEAVLTLRPTLGFWLLEQIWPALAIVDRGDAVTRRAARFLASDASAKPFFLWLHYVDPHAPYAGTTRSFRDDLLAGGTSNGALPRMAQLRAGEIRPSPAGREALRAAYSNAVRAVDAEVGTVVRLLERHALAGDTLVVVTADHGEEFWDHGGVEHGHTLFDELIRVPLVIRCPGCAPSGARIDETVAIAELAATLLDLLGVAPDLGGAPLDRAAGFAALLRGEPFTAQPVVSENLLFADDRVALRTARYTYVAWANGKEELYDRRRDPRELRDLAARSRLLERHRALLASLRAPPVRDAAIGAVVAPPDDAASPSARASARVSDAARRAVRALGYVE